jgi:succinate dehydrogenase / fumarate reductase cytochrome b subunit
MAEGANTERPLSPHWQIWRWTVTMAASITHRGAGVVLYGGFFLLTLWLLGLGFAPPLYEIMASFFASPFGLVIIAGFVWALLFHLLNGLRHLYWDAGRGLAPNTARMTAWAIYGASAIFTVVILWAALGRDGA